MDESNPEHIGHVPRGQDRSHTDGKGKYFPRLERDLSTSLADFWQSKLHVLCCIAYLGDFYTVIRLWEIVFSTNSVCGCQTSEGNIWQTTTLSVNHLGKKKSCIQVSLGGSTNKFFRPRGYFFNEKN